MPLNRPNRPMPGRQGWLAAGALFVAALSVALAGAWALEYAGLELAISQLHATARSAEHSLAAHLTEREKAIQLLSTSQRLTQGAITASGVTELLEYRQAIMTEFAWLGFVTPQGEVVSATGGLLVGQSVRQRPWFQAATKQVFVGDVHEAVLLQRLMQRPGSREPLRFIDLAAPVLGAQGQLRGVLGAHIEWQWVSDTVEAAVLTSAAREQVELLITDRRGTVIYPRRPGDAAPIPAQEWDAQPPRPRLWPDPQADLTASVSLRATPHSSLGWRILLRQPQAVAMAPIRRLQAWLLCAGTLVGGAFASVALVLASRRAPSESAGSPAKALPTSRPEHGA